MINDVIPRQLQEKAADRFGTAPDPFLRLPDPFRKTLERLLKGPEPAESRLADRLRAALHRPGLGR